MSIKATNDTMGGNGPVPSLLLFCILPKFPFTSRMNERQRKLFEAPKLERTEM